MSLILFIGALHQVRAARESARIDGYHFSIMAETSTWDKLFSDVSKSASTVGAAAGAGRRHVGYCRHLKKYEKNLKKYQLGVDGLSVAT